MSDPKNRSGSRALSRALRRARRKRLLPGYIRTVSQLLEIPEDAVHVVDLERTDELVRTAKAKNEARERGEFRVFHKTWSGRERQEVERLVSLLGSASQDRRMYLFLAQSWECGAVETSSKVLFDNAFRILSLDQEDLAGIDEDASHRVHLSHTTDWGKDGPYERYEVTLWGDEWVDLASSFGKEHSPA